MNKHSHIFDINRRRGAFGLALALAAGFGLLQPAWANNISVSNVSWLPSRFGSFIQFDLQWENSWRNDLDGGEAPYNCDAAWVFAKWRTNDPASGMTGDWRHVTLRPNDADHEAPDGAALAVGLDGRPGEWGTNGVGVFVFRSANGSGLFSAPGMRLRWARERDGVDDAAAVEVRVCAIEMVHVPEGAHYLGSTNGGTEANRIYAGGAGSNTPFRVTNENELAVGDAAGQLYYLTDATSYGGDRDGIISNAFPKGYAAFYAMKHEVTQEQYVDFLNSLTRTQQEKRFVSTAVGDYSYGSAGQTSPQNRNGVKLAEDPGAPAPRVYGNDLDPSNSPNSTNDGQWVACNFLSWNDLIAYLAWSGLRPMTELEYSKACRGPELPVANERVWGALLVRSVPTNIAFGGTAGEGPLSAHVNCVYGFVSTWGPLRVGCMGVGTGTREDAGASYYGILELAGNVQERTITIGNATGRLFRGTHGEGVLKSDGDPNVDSWPIGGLGAGYLGGAWSGGSSTMHLASRGYVTYSTSSRLRDFGGRGVRTAP